MSAVITNFPILTSGSAAAERLRAQAATAMLKRRFMIRIVVTVFILQIYAKNPYSPKGEFTKEFIIVCLVVSPTNSSIFIFTKTMKTLGSAADSTSPFGAIRASSVYAGA